MKLNLKKKAITSIALISMTDIVFLLLIFLLISSSFITNNGIKINLPDSKSTQKEFTDNIYLTLTKEDDIYINNKMSNWQDIVDDLKQFVESKPDIAIMIQADQDIPLKKIIALIDVTKLAGSKRFFIATKLQTIEAYNER
ncbi:MAG: biopolymer transporter ExbD [Candidatus Cloacimonadales bacterium]|jgi:biopolymer transport protein ExbD|nr:biopolymer transporter ExbD [Candidatus Cloacimonadota bacterium]MDD2650182.1 biopolymer transporter ExbD [Candidatus Cloacimonadota bacterium]MDD3501880.1 biopolymer transporter ExbD [Candidatus Cloacimonadota bacterium]MDX9976963.1 biopolymer transporter ExbD [Candidatus Cloacimonadales bacterium]